MIHKSLTFAMLIINYVVISSYTQPQAWFDTNGSETAISGSFFLLLYQLNIKINSFVLIEIKINYIKEIFYHHDTIVFR